MSSKESMTFENIMDFRHQAAELITDRYTEWKAARSTAEARWKETTQYLYATSTRETSNGDVGGIDSEQQTGWSHSTHIPKLTQIYDNLMANYRFALFPNEKWFKFIGEDQESVNVDKRNVAESYLRTKHRLNGFEEVIGELLADWGIYGNCFAEVTYEQKAEMEDGEMYVDYVGPSVRRISPYDIVFNPMASSFANTPKIVRSVKTMGAFLRELEENPTREYDKEVVEKVKQCRSPAFLAGAGESDKGSQLTYQGFGNWTQYVQSGYVEILDFYGDIYDPVKGELMKDQVITVVDRMWILRKDKIATRTGKPMIFHAGWRTRPDNLWAMGPLDNLIGMQYQINHLENARADAMDQWITPTRIIVGDVDEDGVTPGAPGGEYRIPTGEGSVTNLAPDTTILSADFQIDTKMQMMEILVGSPREAMGFRTPGEKTAFEVSSLENAASRNFQNKIALFEKTLEKIINAELEMGRTYLDGEDVINVPDESLGQRVDVFQSITKNDLRNNGKLVPQGARHFARQQQLIANATQLIQLASADPMVMQHFPSKRLAQVYEDLLGLDNLELFQAFGRVFEQQELQQLMQASQAVGGEQNEEATNTEQAPI